MFDTTFDHNDYSGFTPICIDMGGTNTRIGIFSPSHPLSFELVEKFNTFQDYGEQLSHIVSALKKVDIRGPQTINISVGAHLTKDGRSITSSSNLPDFIDKPLADDLENIFDCHVFLAQDAACGMIAETRFGSLKNATKCAFVSISTSVCCATRYSIDSTNCLIVSTRLGHQILDSSAQICLCGQTGCLSSLIGGKQLQLNQGVSIADVLDPSFWDTYYTQLAIGLINLSHIANIDTISIGGGIALNHPGFKEKLESRINAHIRHAILNIFYAELGENAPLIGASLLHVNAERRHIIH